MAITTSSLPTDQTFALFEASNIKQFIIDQLNAGGIYIDQNYIGSNLNAFIEIISVLLQQIQFHYNTTASESTFTTASLFENMNKIVSLFNYKPSGKQTSILPIKIEYSSNAYSLESKLIPRYSYINYNRPYVLKNDVSLLALDDGAIDDIMFQGTLTESEVFEATGEDFQVLNLIDTYIKQESEKFISDNFFDVYVREPGGKWTQYKEINSLFEANPTDYVYERRLNENLNYEFKFGNNVNGYKPVQGTEIVIFYIISDGNVGVIGNDSGSNTIISKTNLFEYTSPLYNQIMNDLSNDTFFNAEGMYITNSEFNNILVSNTGASTLISSVESVDIIRNNAPKLFVSQNRLLTANDYSVYIKKLYNTFIKDVTIFDNNFYTNSYLKYFYNIGLKAPNLDSRVLLNQVSFQTSCSFNNVYLVLLPLINTIIDDKIPNFVNENLKQYIIDSLEQYKDITHNITPIDPIYKAVSFGMIRSTNNAYPSDFDDVKLELIRDKYSNFNANYIKNAAVEVFKKYFNNTKLGGIIDIAKLSTELLQIPGVKSLRMSDGTYINRKLTFVIWNPLYEESDFTVTQQSVSLTSFMYQYFYDLKNIISKINVINE